MNFGKNAITRALKAGASRGEKYSNFLVLAFARALFFCALLGGALFAAAGFGAVRGIMDSAPDLNISSISSLGYATNVYDASGALTDLFRPKAIVLAVILYFAMKKISLHPIVFLAASAVVGILLRFAGA